MVGVFFLVASLAPGRHPKGLGHIIVGRKPTSFPSYSNLASILPGSSLSQNSHVLAKGWLYPASELHALFTRGAMGLQAGDGMPKVGPC